MPRIVELSNARFVLRSLRRSPVFAAFAVAVLATTLALNATVTGVVDGLAHPVVPYRDAGELFRVVPYGRGAPYNSFQLFATLRDRQRITSDVTAYSRQRILLKGSSVLEVRMGVSVRPNFFDVLGVEPLMGRLFSAHSVRDERDVAVVSVDVWKRISGGATAFRPIPVQINGRTITVIGVAPRLMKFPPLVDVWLALPPESDLSGTGYGPIVQTVIRLRPGLAPTSVDAELREVATEVEERSNLPRKSLRFTTRTILPEPLPIREFHVAMLAATVLVLLVACANLANLLTIRAAERRREIAIRLALGATPSTILALGLAEIGTLTMIAGAVAALIAHMATALLADSIPARFEVWGIVAPHLSWRVFLFGLGLGVIAMLAAGLVPAILSSRTSPAEPLKAATGGVSPRRKRLHQSLVSLEVAMSLVLVVAAGVLIRSAIRINTLDFGYRPDGLVVWSVDQSQQPTTGSLQTRPAALTTRQLVERVRTSPEVASVASMSFSFPPGEAILGERPGQAPAQIAALSYRRVSPTFLRTMGIPIVLGRDFRLGDMAAAVVDETTARRLWHTTNVVGRMLKLGSAESSEAWVSIVGVSRPAILTFQADPDVEPDPGIFVVDSGGPVSQSQVIVRAANPNAAEAFVGDRLQNLPGLAVGQAHDWLATFAQFADVHVFVSRLFSAFAVIALCLTGLGVYGVASYSAEQRRHEFAVRLSLGAPTLDLVKRALHESIVVVLGGVAVGSILVLWTTRFLSYWLYGVKAWDFASLLGAEGLIAALTSVALLAPTWRSARINPLDALRNS